MMTQAGALLFVVTATLSPQTVYMMSLKRHPQGAVAGFYTFPSKNADKCLTGTKEYLEQVLAKLQAPNSSLRYVWYNSTVQEGFCPDRFMQHDRSGDLCFPDVEVWIDNDASPILNTNHVRMGSLYKIRHHDFAFPDVKINHPVVMVECLNGTTVGVESAVATSAVDADAKAVSLLATANKHPQGAVAGFYTFPSKNADKCLTGTKEYLEQVLAKLQAPNSSLRYVWYNSTVQEGFCPDRFMQHDKSGDLCFPDVEVWIDNDASPILNTNHVRMGSLYKIRHHDFAFPDVKINHPVVMIECLNGTTVGVESAVATSAVDADAKAVSLLATAKQEDAA